MASGVNDLILLPGSMEADIAMPMDVAVDAACARLGLPLFGGPSGNGWSKYSLAQTCPHLFRKTYMEAGSDGHELTHPAEQLQIGALFHTLLGLYYAYGLDGEGNAYYWKRGLLAPDLESKLKRSGRRSASADVKLAPDAADKLLAYLETQAEPPHTDNPVDALLQRAEARPGYSMIQTAKKLFDGHTSYYGAGREDCTPLAVEWFAKHPITGYTCRYDCIARLGENDPFVQDGTVPAGSTVVYERKSSGWMSEWATEGWFLDGEILGQLWLWEPSGCARVFGPLAGLIVDVTTKEKVTKYARIFVPPNPVTIHAHARGVTYQNAEMALWEATGFYPKRWVSCFRFGKKCGLYEACRAETAVESLEGFGE